MTIQADFQPCERRPGSQEILLPHSREILYSLTRMNQAIILVLWLLFGSIIGGVAQESTFQPIFDGKTLTGWKAFPEETSTAWSIQDGLIQGESNGGPESYLAFTQTAFSNFELKLEYRFLSEEANSGVQVRSHLPDERSERLRGYHADFGHVGIGTRCWEPGTGTVASAAIPWSIVAIAQLSA